MSDNNEIHLHYCVYGMSSSDAAVLHVGVTSKAQQPENVENRSARVSELPGNCAEDASAKCEPYLFEIESFPTIDGAREAVAFWRRYFRFLGLAVSDGEAELSPAV